MKKFLFTLGVLPFMLTACGGSASFYGRSYQLSGTYDTFEEKVDGEITNRQALINNFASIDWSQGSSITDHSSPNAVINEMKTKALAAFSLKYNKDFKIVVNSKESGFATVYTTEKPSGEGFKTKLAASGSYLDIETAGGTLEYRLYHIQSYNGRFAKVGLSKGGADQDVAVFTLYYTQKISGLDGIEVKFYANFA